MDPRFKFNEDEENYDKHRPTYVKELYQDIINYSGICKDSVVLEIGIGTGQATLPFLETGCNITAVELGDKLVAYSRKKFSNYQNIEIINADFTENNWNDNSYDLVFSATAFHWIPQKLGYNMVKSILKSKGTIALFWNHPFPNRLDDETNIVNRRVYNKYRPSSKPIVEFTEEDCQKHLDVLEQHGFTDITSKLYYQVRTLKSDEYISLLNTYSDHRALPLDIKTAFEKELKQAIDNINGEINIYDTIDLYLARKL